MAAADTPVWERKVWVKVYRAAPHGWRWVLVTDPDDWAGSQVCMQNPDQAAFGNRENAVAAARGHNGWAGEIQGVLP